MSGSTTTAASGLLAGVDFSSVTSDITAAGAAGITMLLAWVAVKYVRRVVRSA